MNQPQVVAIKGATREKTRATEKIAPVAEGEIMIKTTWRMPKTLLKQLKQYGLDNDMTLQHIAMRAFKDLLEKE